MARLPHALCMLAKETKGGRSIFVFTMMYRVWSRTRKICAGEWSDARASFWDDAVRGSSPPQAALRGLFAEEACAVLFDVECFYDSTSLTLVARAGLTLTYPPALFALALTYAGVLFRR